MLRGILGVIAGYIAIFIFIFTTFTGVYLAMGADWAFKPASYEVSMGWSVTSVILGIVAAVIGGLVCAAISRGRTAPRILALLVLVLGLLGAIPILTAEQGEPKVRTGEVSNLEAAGQAIQPRWAALMNPFIGAAGVLLGAMLVRPRSGA